MRRPPLHRLGLLIVRGIETNARVGSLVRHEHVNRETEPQAACLVEAEPRAARPRLGRSSVTARPNIIRTLGKSN